MRFYSAAGERVEAKNTKEVKAALANGLLPSVTTILSVIRFEHLENWLIRGALEHYEEFNDFKAALKYRDTEAADFGTVCHHLLESHLQGQPCPVAHDKRHRDAMQPLYRWLEDNVQEVLFTESRFFDTELGYAGTADLLVLLKDERQCLLDLKTKKKSDYYPLQPDFICKAQLSSYRSHFEKHYGPMAIGNLFIASPFGEAPRPCVAFRDYGYQSWMEGFQAAYRLWAEQHEVTAILTRLT